MYKKKVAFTLNLQNLSVPPPCVGTHWCLKGPQICLKKGPQIFISANHTKNKCTSKKQRYIS